MKSKIQNPQRPGRTSPGKSKIQNLLLSLGLFLLALLPRAYDLPRFVTADEAKWVYRSAQFWAALLQGDFAGTTVNLTPAVTTTWLGGLGLLLYHRLHQAALGLPLLDWLLSLPEFGADLEVLIAARWPLLLGSALAVVAIYGLARRLFSPPVAFIGAMLIALDPHTVSLTRILGHDAPVALFMTLSLLLMLLAFRRAGEPGSPSTTLRTSRGTGGQGSRGAGGLALEDSPPHPRTSAPPLPPASLLALSGVAAGLAFLSKAPALFLIPFAGLLFLSKIWRNPAAFWTWLKPLALWGLIAYLTFVIVWPAAWLEPLGRPAAVVENAFLSATDQEEADEEGFWLVPDLGPFYYVVNGGFKLSPLVLIGTALALFFLFQQTKTAKTHLQPSNLPISQSPREASNLLFFALLFTLFMTLGGKRSPRYILPIFPALSLVAAWGWWNLFQLAAAHFTPAKNNAPRPTPYGSRFTVHVLDRLPGGFTSLTPLFHLTLLLSALLILLPTAPYYFTYYNPLLGGTLTAPRLVKIGWGEGLDQVGRYLQRVVPGSRVGTAYSSTVAPYFDGDLAGLDSDQLDYVVLYIKQVQGGDPPLLPSVVRYYQHNGSLFSVNLNGLPYAEIYPGPAVQLTEPNLGPLGFRATTPYGRLGESLTVDLLWPPPAGPTGPVSLSLMSSDGAAGLTAAALPNPINSELVISSHRFALPPDWPRGRYQLRLEDQPLGELDLRHFQVPARLSQPEGLIFGEQIALAGYNFQLTEDYIRVSLAWRAEQARLPDYTAFVQLLDAETNERLAGFDSPPLKGTWPTSRWVAGEVVADEVLVAVPPDLQPGFLKLIVGLYRPDTGQRLTLPDGQDHWAIPWTVVRK